MNEAKKTSKRKAKAEQRKASRKDRELVHLRARDLKGKLRIYPKREG